MKAGWPFLTNHALTLACLLRQPEVTLAGLARHVGISRRATQTIVNDLVSAGYVERDRVGRRNRYLPRLPALENAMYSSLVLYDSIQPLLAGALTAEGLEVGREVADLPLMAARTRAVLAQSRATLRSADRLLRRLTADGD